MRVKTGESLVEDSESRVELEKFLRTSESANSNRTSGSLRNTDFLILFKSYSIKNKGKSTRKDTLNFLILRLS